MSDFKKQYLKLIEIEKDYVNLKINEEYVWPYFRNKIIGILHQESFVDTNATNIKENILSVNKKTTLQNIDNTDVLVFMFNRIHYDNSMKIKDNITDDLCEYFNQNNINYEKVLFKNESFFETPFRCYDICDIELQYKQDLKKKINFFKNDDLNQLSQTISKELNIKFNAHEYVHEISAKLNSYHKLIGRYFEQIKPKYIVITSNYMRNEIVSAAKKRDIKVVECQYAPITKYHHGYHYDQINIPYYPDIILTWSDYFKEFDYYPQNCQAITFGKNKEHLFSQGNSILFVSQNFVSKKFQAKAIEFAKKFTEEKFIFRKHPNEFLDFEFINEVKKINNLTISNNTLSEDLQLSKTLIATSSTLIYDGLFYNKNIYIMDSYLSIFSEDLIKEGLVNKLDDYPNNRVVKHIPMYDDIHSDIGLFKDLDKIKSDDMNTNVEVNNDITIVISTYNCQNSIANTLKSIAQSRQKFKVIISDDCSTDITIDIVKEFSQFIDLKVIESDTNSGDASIPRNKALELVKTKYVYFMDSDDILVPSTILKSLNVMETKKLDFIKFKSLLVNNTKSSLLHPGRKFTGKENSSLKNSPFIWNGIYKMEIIKNNDMLFRQGIAEDLNFNVKYFKAVKKYQYIYQVGIVYQKFNSNISVNLNFDKYIKLLDNHIDTLNEINEFYSKAMKKFFINDVIYKMLVFDNDYFYFINKLNEEQKNAVNNRISILLDIDTDELEQHLINYLKNNLFVNLTIKSDIITMDINLSVYTCELIGLRNNKYQINILKDKYLKLESINQIISDEIVTRNSKILVRTKIKKDKIIIKKYKNKLLMLLILILYGNKTSKIKKRIFKLYSDLK